MIDVYEIIIIQIIVTDFISSLSEFGLKYKRIIIISVRIGNVKIELIHLNLDFSIQFSYYHHLDKRFLLALYIKAQQQ